MSRGPIIDTGLQEALFGGRQQGINIFAQLEEARQNDLRLQELQRQREDLNRWRDTQAVIDREQIGLGRERIAQDDRDLGFRQSEADSKRAADQAAGNWYKSRLPGAGTGMMRSIAPGTAAAPMPMQLPDPMAVAPTEHLKLLTELEAQRQSQSMQRQQAYAERAARVQLRKAAIRAHGGDDHDVYENLKATGDEEFADWSDTDFEAAKSQTAAMFEQALAPHVQAGRLAPGQVKVWSDSIRAGDTDLKEASDLAGLALRGKEGAATYQPTPQDIADARASLASLKTKPDEEVAGFLRMRKGGFINQEDANISGTKRDPNAKELAKLDLDEAQDELATLIKELEAAGFDSKKKADLEPQIKEAKARVKTARAEYRKYLQGATSGGGASAPAPAAADPLAQARQWKASNPMQRGETEDQYLDRMMAALGIHE